MSRSLEIRLGQFSDRGIKPANEDFYGALIPEGETLTLKGAAFAIADGMSSSELARLAAEYAIKNFLNDYFATPDSWTVRHSGERVLSALNRWLCGQSASMHDPARGMVTTFSALVLKSTTAHLFHIGDTRIWQLRGATLEPLTRDHHSWVSAQRVYLNRALGIDTHLEIDYRSLSVEIGDRYLLTTDGIHEYVPPLHIKQLIAENCNNLDAACRALTAAARIAGSPDNLSCQLLCIDNLPTPDVDSTFRKLTELPFPPPLEPGMVLDGYHILREIHSSPRSQLYLARDGNSGKLVALKTPSVNFEDDPGYLERFRHEEWVGRRIQNPHVLKVIETTQRRRFLYHILEYLDGQTLRQWMADHPHPPLIKAREILEQIASGIRAFHRLDMLHRDLKPENIHIDQHGIVRIIDFGSTKIAGIAEIASPIMQSDLLGTKNYVAPEILLGAPATTSADLFAFGVIAYELLTGHLPYGERLGREINAKWMARLRYMSARNERPDLPVWVDGALEKAVRLDPRRRYAVETELPFDLRHPNSEFIERPIRPLLERNPVGFWRTIALLSLLGNLVLFYWLHPGG
ncbi:MAG: bifunctional protein-serine/threonine kinase/phosphatase [Candidatus Competibacteraceae bacterium]|nr:bifunctional protein-serine/threonine kinase/phosphatase [Candidatus Competibacteraceae bacterium]